MNEQRIESAGRLATVAVPRTTKEHTAADVLVEVQSFSTEYESIDYIYVLQKEELVGVISLHELLAASPQLLIGDLMTHDVAYVHQHTDQENVAHLALAQNIKAVPVINSQNAFIGVVTADTILRILRDEHTEDILKFAGINFSASEQLSQFTTSQHFFSRLPWLIIGLGGGILAAWVVEKYSYTIENELFLAAFIPAIVYIADSVGSQTQMVYVRSLTNQLRVPLAKSLGKELLIATLIGITLSILIASISWVWLGNTTISIILAASVVATVYFSVITAIVLPWLFDMSGKDPALATGPLATVIRDVSSLAIYFFIAMQIL